MIRTLRTLSFLFLLVGLVTPGAGSHAHAAQGTTSGATTTSPNIYIADTQVVISTPVSADLSALGGSIDVYAPVAGNVLALGGTVLVEKPVEHSVRAAGGRVIVSGSAGGDVATAGGSVTITGTSSNIFALGGTVNSTGGSTGDVTLYGANVNLAGTYGGNVTVIASNRFTLGDETHIKGNLRYNAPQQIVVPAGSSIAGAVTYTGSYSYVPTNEEARRYAVAGAGIFFIVRVLAGMIVAGLIAGLFPQFANAVIDFVVPRGARRIVLSGLLGFALFVATPILILLLFISFVGAGLAFVFGPLYLLLALLAYVFAGILVGAVLRKFVLFRLRGYTLFTWKDAVIGTIVLHLIALIPVVGLILTLLLTAISAGSIAALSYGFAFRARDTYSSDSLA
ncbi:MAG: hypothetical protein V4480_03620 [Patescibacteria group bacterium]